jgi:hypothetical protein
LAVEIRGEQTGRKARPPPIASSGELLAVAGVDDQQRRRLGRCLLRLEASRPKCLQALPAVDPALARAGAGDDSVQSCGGHLPIMDVGGGPRKWQN